MSPPAQTPGTPLAHSVAMSTHLRPGAKVLLAATLAVCATLTVTKAAPASAWMRDVTVPPDSFAVVLEPYESDAVAADWYAARDLCDNEIVPKAHELGFTWLKPYYCSDKLNECAPFAKGS